MECMSSARGRQYVLPDRYTDVSPILTSEHISGKKSRHIHTTDVVPINTALLSFMESVQANIMYKLKSDTDIYNVYKV